MIHKIFSDKSEQLTVINTKHPKKSTIAENQQKQYPIGTRENTQKLLTFELSDTEGEITVLFLKEIKYKMPNIYSKQETKENSLVD